MVTPAQQLLSTMIFASGKLALSSIALEITQMSVQSPHSSIWEISPPQEESRLGLRWEDLDFENRIININHSIVYYPVGDSRNSVQKISKPKTEAGIRTIPMLDTVYDAFMMEREEQEETGFNQTVIDGMSGFVFINKYGGVPNPQAINRTIKRISHRHYRGNHNSWYCLISGQRSERW